MKFLFGLAPLATLAAQFDSIRLDSPRPAATVLIIEGRRADHCTVPEIRRGAASVRLRNLLSSQTCRSRVAAFSAAYAAQLILTDETWTDAAGDVLRIKLEPRIAIPVHTWVLYDPCAQESCSETEREWSRRRVKKDLQRANDVFKAARSGLTFESTGVEDLTGEATARSAWDLGCTPDGRAARTALGHAPGALNVYYVRETGPRGLWCEPDTILINGNASDVTLVHEIGHALGLDHIEHIRGMHEDNLMNTSGPMRTLTLAQLFRANFSVRSIVNRLRLRTGPVVDCATEDACPALTLDLRRPAL